MSDSPPHDASPKTDRRALLGLLARGGALVAAGSVIGLSGCGSSRRARAAGSTIGQPIPADPSLQQAGPVRLPPRSTPAPLPRVAPTPSLAGAPRIVARSSWTRSGPVLSRANAMGGIDRITIHHDALPQPAGGGWADVVRRLESIRRGHVNNQKWADIGYHYAVDPAGRVWSCRPLELQGAHVRNRNEHNLGILVVGNFSSQMPTPQALDSLERLVGYEMRRFAVPVHRVRTHRELAQTACPGRHLQPRIERMRTASATIAASNAEAVRRS
ncbi:MAG: peptidoglycan recognition family protein [Planctomycetota bacterium]